MLDLLDTLKGLGVLPKLHFSWPIAPYVAFWPEPADPKVPHWWEHFITYVYGATNVSHVAEPLT